MNNTEWFISGNPKRFDVIKAFRDLRKIDWRQSANIEASDIVYIYLSESYQCVKLKCRVNKVNLPNVEIDDSRYNLIGNSDNLDSRFMELELLEEFDTELFNRAILSKYGFSSPQSPVRVPEKVKEYMDVVQYLLHREEMDPDKYDGSYELARETVRAYKNMGDISGVDYLDLNLLYHMVIGTFKMNVERKKESVDKSHLPESEKTRIKNLIDEIWEKAENRQYENREDDKPTIGMFGTGFYTFNPQDGGDAARTFIGLCVEIFDLTNDDEIFSVVEKYLNRELKGLKAASATVMLHCFKPFTFPVLNTNYGSNTIYEYFGIELDNMKMLSTLAKNCRNIKEFRDKHFKVKNYRIYDRAARMVNKSNAVINTVSQTDELENSMIDTTILQEILKAYKDGFVDNWKNEQFKWEAIKHFQDNWDINASDFAVMLENSLSKTYSLLLAVNYFPSRMIVELAEARPEKVRYMFKDLFDEGKDVYERIATFKDNADILIEECAKGKNHFQSESAISIYLWLRYPYKYYIYKYGVVKKTAEILKSNYSFTKGSYENNIKNFYKFYNEICTELKKDQELVGLMKSHLSDDCYPDPDLRTLTIDLGVYISRYFGKKSDEKEEIDDMDESELSTEWFPALTEYTPGFTKDQWLDLCKKILGPVWGGVMLAFYKAGGAATCTQIAEKLGLTPPSVSGRCTQLAKRIYKETNCPVSYRENGNIRYWSIVFQGKKAELGIPGGYIWKLREPLKDAINELYEKGWFDTILNQDLESSVRYPHNMILYGPPGTGKTYSSIIYAIAICENKSLEEILKEVNRFGYNTVLDRFDQYRDEGRIAFTTFHQSYGYEEFIEGIKPVVDDSDEDNSSVKYVLEEGLFKEFCNRALLPVTASDSSSKNELNKNPNVWKVSLQGTGDNPTRTECFENDHIRIGWDGYGEVITDDIEFKYGGKAILNSFINKMQIGDIVLSCYSASTIDAIGVITGEYEWHREFENYCRVRSVKWLAKNINYNIVDMNGGSSMTLSTVYKMKVSVADVFKILDEVGASDHSNDSNSKKNYVFVIDEINRGNISKIFGELITLIEDSKRIGANEELRLELPYSKKLFGVPDNVYIIGTMNTADRSIALMDTALRRRFDFIEMMPGYDVLDGIIVKDNGETLDIKKLLEIINLRIEYLYDREHTIGHSFFVPLRDDPSIEKLAEIFSKNVIPLLKEYFYEDYSKIQLVLGDNNKEDEFKFIKEKKLKLNDVFNGDISDLDIPEQTYEIQTEALMKIQSYKTISKDL